VAASSSGTAANATLLRVVRLLRVFRIVSVLPEMRVLVQGLLRSFAPLASMAVLTLLLFYVYGMIGWLAFSDQDPEHWDTITQSMLTLFSVLTLEEWVAIQDTVIDEDPWAWAYFVSFVLLSAFVLLNMVIAIVINSVEDAREVVKREERRRELAELARERSYEARCSPGSMTCVRRSRGSRRRSRPSAGPEGSAQSDSPGGGTMSRPLASRRLPASVY